MRVKRFTPALNLSGTYPTPAMTEHVAGRYVSYDDHEKIETELAALKNERNCDQENYCALLERHDDMFIQIGALQTRVAELEKAGAEMIRDLRMRGSRDSESGLVVNVSNSVWVRFCDLIEGPENG
jgi:hypothetical protein